MMASIMKFTDSDVVKLLKHDDRRILHDRNEDIDPDRTHLNYDLTPVRTDSSGHILSKQDFYKQRKAEVYCYNRKDIKTVAGCIITLPKELTDESQQRLFFESVSDFLSTRYGEDNVLSMVVHYDEGKTLYQKDAEGEIIRDSSGKGLQEFHLGQPHLHCLFMPVIKIDHASLMKKKNHVKAMENYTEKISAADVLNKKELQRFHPDLQKYLDAVGLSCNVNSGITKEQGGNRLVTDYKKEFDSPYVQSVLKENRLLKEKVAGLSKDNEKLKTRVETLEKSAEKLWGKENIWGEEKTW